MSKKQNNDFTIMSNENTITNRKVHNVIINRKTLLKDELEKYHKYALGLNIKLSSFIDFSFPLNEFFHDSIQLSISMSKIGYCCIEEWNVKLENVTKYFFLLCFISLKYYEPRNSKRTFAKICEYANQFNNNCNFFYILLLNDLPKDLGKIYFEKLVNSLDDKNNFQKVYDSIEIICIYYLEQVLGKKYIETIFYKTMNTIEDYMINNDYDFLNDITINRIQEKKQNNMENNNLILDDDLHEGPCSTIY